VALAEALSLPVATSLNGKGCIPGNHPLSLGVVGSYSAWCANQIVHQADLVLFVGSHTGDQVTNGWTIPASGTPVIQIDIEPTELGRSYPNAVALCGDAKVTLGVLIEALAGAAKKEAWAAQARQTVAAWDAEIEPLCSSDAVPIKVERLCRELTRHLPPDAVLVADTGWSGIWTGTMVYLNHPGQTYLRAAGSLGWSFPAALGAKCGAPQRPVVCFSGDGAFYYHLGELETAVRCGINTVTVINNNSCFGQCVRGVQTAYGSQPGNAEEIYRFAPVDFAGLARSMGCLGIKVERPQDIAPALKEALTAQRPAVIEVITDPASQAPDPWTPKA
jgi:acetolactate synthase-1/2/3 large subunit